MNSLIVSIVQASYQILAQNQEIRKLATSGIYTQAPRDLEGTYVVVSGRQFWVHNPRAYEPEGPLIPWQASMQLRILCRTSELHFVKLLAMYEYITHVLTAKPISLNGSSTYKGTIVLKATQSQCHWEDNGQLQTCELICDGIGRG
jgi:hypothetical protein